MTGREAALLRSQCESLRRTSSDLAGVASSLKSEDAGRSVRDLSHPPSVRKAMRTAGIALAVAPEPFTTIAGVALVAGSFAAGGEPATLKSTAEELRRQMSEISALGLADLTISV